MVPQLFVLKLGHHREDYSFYNDDNRVVPRLNELRHSLTTDTPFALTDITASGA
jgi:hypothetical protein